jgi:hypothetical protein
MQLGPPRSAVGSLFPILTLTAAFPVLFLAPMAAAQQRPTAEAGAVEPGLPLSEDLRRPRALANAGMSFSAGELWAAGATYKAHFAAPGPMIVPPLGSSAPRSLPLWLDLQSITLGEALVLDATTPVAPVQQGMTAVYEHAAGILERYEARVEGLEQSFVIPTLPAASGDLVVRVGFASELAPRAEGAGLFFDDGRGFGLRVGGVTGIDANGARASGTVEIVGGVIELRLPASFVASAALPLVVDPLIGGADTIYDDDDSADADAAYDVTFDDYLVVFERQWSATDVDVYGQRISAAGTLVGTAILFETTITNVATDPAVANCNESNKWLCVWQQDDGGDDDIIGRACNASDGTLGSAFTIAGTTASEVDPDVGGEEVLGFDEVMVVWDGTGIRAARVTLPVAGGSSVATLHTITTDVDDTAPKISNSGGGPGNYVVAWERFFTGSPGDNDIYGAVIAYTGTIEVTAQSILTTIGPDEESVAVDGDGTNFALVYEKQAASGSGDNDIMCRELTVSTSAGTLVDGPETLLDGDSADEIDPVIGFTGSGYIVVWRDGSSGLHAVGLKATDCSICELEYTVASGSTPTLGIATEATGGGSGDEALVAYELVSTTGSIKSQLLDTLSGGLTSSLGGGCGSGGTAGIDCPAKVNSNFKHTLTGAATLDSAFLVIGLERLDLPCGSCTVVPNPFTGFVIATTTGATGAATVTTQIPNDPAVAGLVIYDQWAVVPGSGSCAAFGSSFSNALKITIQ